MEKEKHVVIGIGSPSDMVELEKKYQRLGSGSTVFEYLESRDTRQLKDPVRVSCHRTLNRAIAYAGELQDFSEDNRVVAVLYGTLSLQLPAIMSSETDSVPVIGVPGFSATTHGGGIDAFTAVCNLPPDTVVAGTPIHYPDESPGIDRGIYLAERLLRMEDTKPVLVGDSEGVGKAAKVLDTLGIGYETRDRVGRGDDHRLVLGVCRQNSELTAIDSSVHQKDGVAIQCKLAPGFRTEGTLVERLRPFYSDFFDTLVTLDNTHNTLYLSRPDNAALFVGRVLAMYSHQVRDLLNEYAVFKEKKTKDKYGSGRIPLDEMEWR